jgi:DNA-binding transcriptional regulator YiaG
MADDLADFPIVVLEADYPEAVGKIGLFDIHMPVGLTGIVFVAAVPGRLYVWGPNFTDSVRQAANLRAASTLVHMGLINGDTFTFLRSTLQITQADLATQLGVPFATVQGWEDGSIEIPRLSWTTLAQQVVAADGRSLPVELACPPNFRGRKIRVFPNIPMETMPQSSIPSDCNPGVSLVSPDCEPPVAC